MKRYTKFAVILRRALFLLLTTAFFSGILAHAEPRRIEKRISPVYPELAKRMHLSGQVRLSVTVAADGSVSGTKLVTGNTILSIAAEDAVHKWVFSQADAPSTEVVEVNFEATN
jgi:TonB family protein